MVSKNLKMPVLPFKLVFIPNLMVWNQRIKKSIACPPFARPLSDKELIDQIKEAQKDRSILLRK